MTDIRPSVLVVDDDRGVLESLELLLSDDCDVVVSDSASRALELATRLHFDVVVTDYRMPEMNGAEFTAALTARIKPSPYMLMLTGTPNEVKPGMPGAMDLVMVLAKPFDPARLLRMVLQVGRLAANRRPSPVPATDGAPRS
ncbi:MAG: response regulator [Archangium sp.]